jgi:glycerol-3-phosphate O-acyltransferase
MAEHYSNLDLPEFFYFLDKAGPEGRELADSLVAIAGMKLSLEDPNVALFASIYSRIVICPSRTLSRLNPEQDKDKIAKIKAINLAAARKLNEIKTQGKIMLVYPTGTRYRPWEPDSKRAVREVDSYVKGFDWVCFVAKTGLILRVRQETEHNMLLDYVTPDTVRFTVSGPVSCAGFRSKARLDAEERGVEDKKQAVADAVMEKLEEMHRAGNPYGAGG